ncbi:hypothetical protein E4T44_02227 [Aureobasidium sp. EXF-8845]|nr:hypothetical protein E4T44_02227 [Aureobasidium sp. EXF-8845]KAI4856225.1 hypothetical protein E4T45_02323 [Aureobasidium sp. EXF-8846]
MSRPQIGIDRLPVRRSSNEPKEAMNCKSCRKRKVCLTSYKSRSAQKTQTRQRSSATGCDRLVKPAKSSIATVFMVGTRISNTCRIMRLTFFSFPNVDAVPKKRGPKTDVLEALLKRVNGLEKRLKDEGKDPDEGTQEAIVAESVRDAVDKKPTKKAPTPPDALAPPVEAHQIQQQRPQPPQRHPSIGFPDQFVRQQAPSALQNNTLLDAYFTRIHSKPYYILDEAATRQRWQTGQLPPSVINAIHAVTARFAPQHLGGHNAAVRHSEDCAVRARNLTDIDDPTIENVQVLLLLSNAFFQAGKGKKSYMLLTSAISMAYALNLHRELPAGLRISPNEREGRRKLFWTCYIMDRFLASGSKRPSLIADEAIFLRLPGWQSDSTSIPYEGNFFSNGINLPMSAGPGRLHQSGGSMLIEISRILGITNRYLAAGGVKGDSHFPWHAQSNLSKIRQDLDTWASGAQDAFLSIEALFGQTESQTLVLSKLVYHLIHCLIYRPFLPIDLTELSGTGQHQSWQIEATNLCFLHANAISELTEIGKHSSITDWPAYVGYCLCTAGTIHVHGAHYPSREGDVFTRSAEFLSKEMSQLSEMRIIWAGVQHQRETLQTVYGCHSQLVKSLATNPMRFSPVFQMEDFFDRYPGQFIDGAHITFSDITVEALHESLPAYNGFNNTNGNRNGNSWQWSSQPQTGPATSSTTTAIIKPSANFNNDLHITPASRKRRRTNDATSPPIIPAVIHDPALNPLSPDFSNPLTSPTATTLPPHTTAADENQIFSQNPLSPSFSFSPWQSHLSLPMDPSLNHSAQFDNLFSIPDQNTQSNVMFDQQTPGGLSANGSVNTEGDKDPFMSLLEQLAENEQTGHGGPSDLDFFLSSNGGQV